MKIFPNCNVQHLIKLISFLGGSPGFGASQPGTGFGQSSGSPGFGVQSPSSGFGPSAASAPAFNSPSGMNVKKQTSK